MIPFRCVFEPGSPVGEQVVYAAKKAIVAGRIRPGDAFPSVRSLSRELKINPNTAHKVVAHLLAEGLLEVAPGVGTRVRKTGPASAADRKQLLDRELEALVVEAKRLGLGQETVAEALADHWQRLDGRGKGEKR